MKPRGFTLVELLATVSLVIVLATVGVPVLRMMKSRSAASRCIAHLHDWGITIGSYAADHDGKVHWEQWHPISHQPKKCSPYVPYWTGGTTSGASFDIHLKERCCPAVSWNKEREGNAPVSYAMIQPTGISKVGVSGRTERGLSSDYALSKIAKPARFMLMIDAMGDGSTVSSAADFEKKVRPLTEDGPRMRHGRAVNVLMADFSIRTMAWDEIQSGLDHWTAF